MLSDAEFRYETPYWAAFRMMMKLVDTEKKLLWRAHFTRSERRRIVAIAEKKLGISV